MGYDRGAPKRAISVEINADLLTQAGAYTQDVSATLEGLLATFVETERTRRQRDEDEALRKVIVAVNRVHAEHGLLSDEFPSL